MTSLIVVMWGLLAAGACYALEPAVSQSTLSVCQDTPQMSCGKPAWEQELERAQKAGEACKKEIDRFCEGIQVGEGRLEACLKTHAKKLSKKCKAAQGFK